MAGRFAAKYRFFVIFRTVTRAFLYYSNSQSDKSPEHWECKNCAECAEERADFEENLKSDLQREIGEKWKKYNLDSLLQTVVDVSEIESNSQNSLSWTIKTDRLVKILKSERSRIERIQNWNSRNTNQS